MAHGCPSPLAPDSDLTKFNHRSELVAWAKFIVRWIHGSNASSPSRFFPLIFLKTLRPVGHNEQTSRVFGWDVAPDGKRILVDTGTTSSEPITVVLNWTAELKKE